MKIDSDIVLEGLYELQKHSIERLKANEEFEETGCATLRVKATITGERPRLIKILKPLSLKGEELISSVAELLDIDKKRYVLFRYFYPLINNNSFS